MELSGQHQISLIYILIMCREITSSRNQLPPTASTLADPDADSVTMRTIYDVQIDRGHLPQTNNLQIPPRTAQHAGHIEPNPRDIRNSQRGLEDSDTSYVRRDTMTLNRRHKRMMTSETNHRSDVTIRHQRSAGVDRASVDKENRRHERTAGAGGGASGVAGGQYYAPSPGDVTSHHDRTPGVKDVPSSRDAGDNTYAKDPVYLPSNWEDVSLHGAPISDESRLIHFLMWKYSSFGTMARPILDSAQPVQVFFRMILVQILDFDETKQILISNVWKSYMWWDEILQWDPDEFGGLEDIRLPPHVIWIPDIVLYNNADEENDHEVHQELIAVFANGTLKWIPSMIYKSGCVVDMANFPFDEQTCLFKFGSWAYDGRKVNLSFLENQSTISMDEYMLSSEWRIVASKGIRHVRNYPCCGDDPYPELIYHVVMYRRTAFYILVLIFPCILLSLLTLVMFWFPPQRPDRTGLGMSLFSSFFVLLLILVQSSPPTSESISLLGVYYCVNMFLIALSTLLSAVVINIHKCEGQKLKLPKWTLLIQRKTFTRLWNRFLGRMVRARRPQMARLFPSSEETNHGILEVDADGQVWIEYSNFADVMDKLFFIVYIFAIIVSMVLLLPS